MTDARSAAPLAGYRRRVLLAFATIATVLLLAALALPVWLKSALESQVAEKSGHRLTIGTISFNPLLIALRIDKLRLATADNRPLLEIDGLLVDVSTNSVLRQALVLDALVITSPNAHVALLADGTLDWKAFVDAFRSPAPKPDASLPRIDIERFVLSSGRIDFADRGRAPVFETRVEPIELELTKLSTLPDDNGQYRISAATATGARIDWRGSFTIAPLSVGGRIEVDQVALGQFFPYLHGRLRIAAPEGTMGAATNYRVAYAGGKLDATLDGLGVLVRDLKLRGANDPTDTLALEKIELRDGAIDFAKGRVALGRILINGGRIDLERRPDGRFRSDDWFVPAPASASATQAVPGPVTPWSVDFGHVALDDLAVRLTDHSAGIRRVADIARVSLGFQATLQTGGDSPSLQIGSIRADLERLSASAGRLPPARIGRIRLADGRMDLRSREIDLGLITLEEGRVDVVRTADGRIPLFASVESRAAGKGAEPDSKAPPWRMRLGEIRLTGFGAGFRDETTRPAAEFGLRNIAASIAGVGTAKPMPLKATLEVVSGGRLEIDGSVSNGDPSADLRVRLTELALRPIQPYLAPHVRLDLVDGRLTMHGVAGWTGARGANFRGGFSLNALRINESGSNNRFLAWKSLSAPALSLDMKRLEVGELTLDGLDTRLMINKDKTINVSKVMVDPVGESPVAALPIVPPNDVRGASAAGTGAPATAAPAFAVAIDRLRIRNGDLDFADLSLALPFGTRIHGLNGAINGLSSRPGAPAQIELDGQVDDYGLARAVGQVDFFRPTDSMDLKVVFRNVEMSHLTPYSATFAGRRIASGKLSLDLEYKIHKRMLRGENQIIMDQLTLGERVETPGATNLPLDLAIAILQDSEGRIDLGLPVSGSLDDPQFSYGAIIWKAILNVVTKIATAPFRALGALFGGSDKFEKIAFEPGTARLTPPEREKIGRLATALEKRPALALEIHGVFSDLDLPALQELQLRQRLAGRMGIATRPDEDPGPLSTRQPKVQAVIETTFGEQFGSGELAAMKEGFRQANPGELAESTAGKMMSRLTGLFREQRRLDEGEVKRMAGEDFHGLLYERLRQRESIPESRLTALATARGEATAAMLKAAGAPGERIRVAQPEKVAGEGRDVPIRLTLGKAGTMVSDTAR